MLTTAVVDLRHERVWEPGRLTAATFRWPLDLPTATLGDITIRLASESFAEEGAAVITPMGVDPMSGGVRRRSRKYQGSVFQVGRELRSGDVLIPGSPESAVLLVTDRLRGALVSYSFAALRPESNTLALWIWAVLNSLSGRQFRAHVIQSSMRPTVTSSSLGGLHIPLPPPSFERLEPAVRELESRTHLEEEEALETWWQTADLRRVEWWIALATPQPEQLNLGEPLERFCSEISRGKNVRPLAVDSDRPGYLPVTDIAVLNGKPRRRWVPTDEGKPVIAEAGDLFVAAIGTRAYATITRAATVADQHLFVLRLRDRALGPALVRYLNGQQGFGLRQVLLRGMTVPSLRKSDIARFPVPLAALDLPVDEAPAVPLAEQLEQTLWTH